MGLFDGAQHTRGPGTRALTRRGRVAALEKHVSTRRRSSSTPSPLVVFWHVAALPGWEGIVEEQLELLRFVELTDVRIGLLADRANMERLLSLAERRHVRVSIDYWSDVLQEYESPTLTRVWDWARENIGGACLYFHTKGASAPHDPMKRQWRRIMQKHVLGRWRENASLLAEADIVGVGWRAKARVPHYPGNFWMARGDWLAHLTDPRLYLKNDPRHYLRRPPMPGRWPWLRKGCEAWIGSKPCTTAISHEGINRDLWLPGDDLWRINSDILGFDYTQFDRQSDTPTGLSREG